MTITFVSNYINHHQIPLSNEIYAALKHNYHFIQVMPMEEERSNMGWQVDYGSLPYLLCYYEDEERCKRLINESDIVIFGGVEDEGYIQERLAMKKITIRYSERLYREGQWKAVSPRGLIKKYKDHFRHRNDPVYLLCTGAYTASDFSIIRSYPNKMFKWGYFTEFLSHNKEELLNNKGYEYPSGTDPFPESSGKKVVEILFAGRFLPLKHPEYAIELADHLRSVAVPFHITIIGDGDMAASLKADASSRGLSPYISFEGFMAPDKVRRYMEKADIFLMTSNHLEGWGAVIPEAMNSGCAVIAEDLIGAVPFLIKHRKSGLVYKEGDIKEFLSYGEELVKDVHLRKALANNAYDVISDLWNPQNAANSLIEFSKGLLDDALVVNKEGPLSPAPVLFPKDGYKFVRREK